jgi:hypothetical protein
MFNFRQSSLCCSFGVANMLEGCIQTDDSMVAFRIEAGGAADGLIGLVLLNRSAPVGGSAYGMPKYSCTEPDRSLPTKAPCVSVRVIAFPTVSAPVTRLDLSIRRPKKQKSRKFWRVAITTCASSVGSRTRFQVESKISSSTSL